MVIILIFLRESKGEVKVGNDFINLMGIENYIERKSKKEKRDISSTLDEDIIPFPINIEHSYFSSQIIPSSSPLKDNTSSASPYFQTYRFSSISKSNYRGKLLISRMKFFV